MPTITMDEVVRVLYRNGVTREDELATMTAIANAESLLDTEQVGKQDPDDLGLWQINTRIHDTVTPECAFDYQSCATQFAIGLLRSEKGYKHWHVYTSGYYRTYLKRAWEAVRRVLPTDFGVAVADPPAEAEGEGVAVADAGTAVADAGGGEGGDTSTG